VTKRDYTTSIPGKMVMWGFTVLGLIGGVFLNLYRTDGVGSRTPYNPTIYMSGGLGALVGYLVVTLFGALVDKLSPLPKRAVQKVSGHSSVTVTPRPNKRDQRTPKAK
jgi:hypothetical protein